MKTGAPYMPSRGRTIAWETPQDLFDALDREFAFTMDVCAIAANTKCFLYYSPEDDGLTKDWGRIVKALRHRVDGGRHSCKCDECRAIKQVCGLATEALAIKASRRNHVR